MTRVAQFTCFGSFLLSISSVPLVFPQSGSPAGAGSNSDITKADWVTYDRDYAGDRYSPLNEIKPDNVSRLQPLCTYDSGMKTSFETGPVVVNGTLYFTTLDTTFAIDADNLQAALETYGAAHHDGTCRSCCEPWGRSCQWQGLSRI